MAEPASVTTVTEASLKAKLQEKLNATYIEVSDQSSGCGLAFCCVVVSPEFSGKTALARTRMVNSLMKEEVAAMHAWSVKCKTPEEWEKQRPV